MFDHLEIDFCQSYIRCMIIYGFSYMVSVPGYFQSSEESGIRFNRMGARILHVAKIFVKTIIQEDVQYSGKKDGNTYTVILKHFTFIYFQTVNICNII